MPSNARSRCKQNDIQRDLAEKEVDTNEHTLGNGENILGHIDLIDQAEVGNNATHRKVGSFAEIVECNQTAHEIGKIVDTGSCKLKDVGKDQSHYRHGQNGIQKTPKNAQHTSLILYFKITRNKLLQQETVSFPNVLNIIQHGLHLSFTRIGESSR